MAFGKHWLLGFAAEINSGNPNNTYAFNNGFAWVMVSSQRLQVSRDYGAVGQSGDTSTGKIGGALLDAGGWLSDTWVGVGLPRGCRFLRRFRRRG